MKYVSIYISINYMKVVWTFKLGRSIDYYLRNDLGYSCDIMADLV